MVEASLTPRTDQYATDTEKHSFNGEYSLDSVIVTLSIALALYNSLEMILLILTTFKKWRGLYFWSLCICNWGVILFALGMMLGYFKLSVLWLSKTVLDIGWVAMVTFQSLILYSRLGLIISSWKILTGVRWMIIIDSIIFCTTVVVLDFGNTYSGSESFAKGYFYIEQIQLICLTVQELIISGLYVWKTIALLKVILKENTRNMIWQLLVINIVIISMDIALVTLQYLHFQLYQEAIKTFVYSVKLKLELNILSKLVDLVNDNAARRSMTLDNIDTYAIQGQAQADVQRELSTSPHPGDYIGHKKDDQFVVIEQGYEASRRSHDSSTKPLEGGEVTRVLSNQSRLSVKTSGGEPNHLYADFLRSMK